MNFNFDFDARVLTIKSRNITGLRVMEYDLIDIEKVKEIDCESLKIQFFLAHF